MAMYATYLLFHHYSTISDFFNIPTHDSAQTFPYLHLLNFLHKRDMIIILVILPLLPPSGELIAECKIQSKERVG